MKKIDNALRTLALHCCAALLVPFRLVGALIGKYRMKTDAQRMLKSIEWANRLAKETGYRYIVLNIKGHYVVKPKQVWKGLLRKPGKYFVKGTTMQDLEQHAVFITK